MERGRGIVATLASTERQHEVFGPTGKTPPEMLRTALEIGRSGRGLPHVSEEDRHDHG